MKKMIHNYRPIEKANKNLSTVFVREQQKFKICDQALTSLWDFPPYQLVTMDFHIVLSNNDIDDSYEIKIPQEIDHNGIITVKYKNYWCNWRSYPCFGDYVKEKTRGNRKLFIGLRH